MHTIFISYASADEKVAASICDALEARGFHCFISYRDIPGGKSHQEAIPLAIEGAKAMVLVFSPRTNASDEVKKELALASRWKRFVIPLRIEQAEPTPAFLYELVNRQWIDYFKDRERSLRELADQLARVVSPDPGPLSNPKPIPESRQWNTAFGGVFGLLAQPVRRNWLAGSLVLAVLVTAAGSIWLLDSERPANPAISVSNLKTPRPETGASKPQPEPPQSSVLSPEAPLDRRKADAVSRPENPPTTDGDQKTRAAESVASKQRPEPPQSVPGSPKSATALRPEASEPVISEALAVLRHADSVNSAAFSPDGTRIVTASYDRSARVWDAATGRLVAALVGHRDTVGSAKFSPDGTRVLTVGGTLDDTARVWDADTGKSIAILRHEVGPRDRSIYIRSAAFYPDGMRIVTWSSQGGDGAPMTAEVWDAATGNQITVLNLEGVAPSAWFSPDGRQVVTARRTGRALDQSVQLWDVATGKLITALGADPDNNWTTRMDEVTGKLIGSGHSNDVNYAAFSPDGTRIVTASDDETARVWDVTTGKQLLVMLVRDEVRSATFSPDGTRIITEASTARLWESETGNLIAVLRGDNSLNSTAFSPDSTRIVTGFEYGDVLVWDASAGKLIAVLRGHSRWASTVAFSPDGKRIVTAAGDGTARVWLAP